jgi:hypothetical protein
MELKTCLNLSMLWLIIKTCLKNLMIYIKFDNLKKIKTHVDVVAPLNWKKLATIENIN